MLTNYKKAQKMDVLKKLSSKKFQKNSIAQNNEQGLALLKAFNFPFRN